jgi:hypothetical protein
VLRQPERVRMTPAAASRPAASREVRSLLADPGAQTALAGAAASSAAAAATGLMSPPAASGAGLVGGMPGGTPLGRCQLLSPVRAKRRDQEQLGAAGQVRPGQLLGQPDCLLPSHAARQKRRNSHKSAALVQSFVLL